MSLLRRKIKRAAVAVLSLTLCASLTASCALIDDGGKSQGTTGTTESLKFTDVTDKFDGTKLTTENFNSSVLAGEGAADETRTVIVTLSGSCILDLMPDNTTAAEYLDTAEGQAALLAIDREQKTFLNKLNSKGIEYKLKYNYATVTNSVAIEVNTSKIKNIKGLGGVASASVSQTYLAPQTVESSSGGGAVENEAFVHATGIYNSEEISERYKDWGSGEGTVVAVIDTGLDYTHDAFSKAPTNSDIVTKQEVAGKVSSTVAYQRMVALGSNLTADDVFVSEKVPYAFDYADTDADVYPSYSNHGTHVAGIIAGQADSYVTKEGEIAKDEAGNDIPFRGVAPEAQLMIFKAFTDNLDDPALGGAESENVMAALNDCVTMGVDVINMSLGSTAGFTTTDDGDDEGDLYNQVIARIQNAGISLICAASNDYSSGYGGLYGTNLASNPDSGTVGSPSTYFGALSVASISGQKTSYVQTSEGDSLFFEEASNGSGTNYEFVEELLKKQDGADSHTYKYVMAGLGQTSNYNSSAVRNFIRDNPGEVIAVVQRGVATFQEKVEAAARAGAAGIIIYNNVSGTVRMSLGDVSASLRIPAVSVSMDAGNKLRDLAAKSSNRISGTITVDRSFGAGPFMSDFSSWGTTPDLKIKPEITAHGGEITSTVPGGYAEQSGTSMASPNMAGLTALVRSYVTHQLSALVGGSNIDQSLVTRLANQLMMSTATIAKDQDGLEYSPRKQGAGLANLHNIITTGAYLYTDNSAGQYWYDGKDYRPKIELGDDKKKTGVYEFSFNVKNFSASAMTFTPKTVFMTETLASDNISVKEQNHPLNGLPEYKVNGSALSGSSFTVAAGETAVVSVKLTLSADEKKYIDDSFKNGMFVEGYVTLSSSGEQCDLNLPFMGFYGDWEAAPMLDYSAFEIAEFKQDTSYTDDTRPQEIIWATQAYGSYNDSNYVIPLGSFLYTLPDSETPMYASEEYCAISCFNEPTESGIGSYVTTYQIRCLYAGLLRNAREVDYRLYDAYTGELITSGTKYRISKAYASGGTARPGYIELELSAADLGLLSNGKYTFEFDFKFTKESVVTEENQFKFDFYVDYEAPVLKDARVRYRDETDSSGKTTQRIYLDVDVFDNHYAQSVMLCYLDTSEGRQELKLATDYVTPVRNANKNGTTTVSIEVTDFWEEYKDTLALQIDDYALNHSTYILSSLNSGSSVENTVNSTTLPSTFELAEGEQNITLNVNEMHKVSLVYDGTANLSNFEWSSPTDYVAVKNGEIVGLASTNGKAYPVFVTNRNGVVRTINVTVTDTEADFRNVSFEFGPVANYNEALVSASGTVSVYAGEDIDLTITANPWYYDLKKHIKSVEWRTSDSTVATVDSDGHVHTLKKGSATISAVIQSTIGSRTVSVDFNVRDEFTISGVTLTRYRGEGETYNNQEHVVIVPADKQITSIGEGAFEDNKVIEKIIIPKTVAEIAKDAFKGCTNLKEVYFMSDEPFDEKNDIADADLSLINRTAFAGCTSLEKVDLSYVKIVSVAREAFKDCVSLKEIIHSEKIGTAYDRAFMGCKSLEAFDMSGLHVAGSNVFSGCEKLAEITTDTFTAIGNGQFAALRYYYEEYNYTTGEWDLLHTDYPACNSLTSVTIKTATVRDNAFKGCENLKTLTFEGVSEARIGASAFENCTALTTVSFNNASIKTLGARVFYGCESLSSITFPDGLESVGADAFTGTGLFARANARSYDTSNDALVSGNTLLKYLGAGGEYTLPAGVTVIAPYAFANTDVTKITNLSQATEIGEGAFSGSLLEEAVLGNLTEIPASAFANTRLTSITLPSSVTYVGDSAFANTPLTAFTFNPASNAAFGSSVFSGCTSLIEIELNAKIIQIGNTTFSGCIRLQRAVMPAVTALGNYTFWNTPSLTEVTFNSGARVTGEYTFAAYTNPYFHSPADRPSLKSVTLGSSLTEIGAGAFFNCTGLDKIALNGAEKIGDYAFYNVPLTAVTGLSSVKTIGAYAFFNCRLQTLALNSAETVGDGAFTITGGRAYTSVEIPVAVSIGINAFYGGNETTVNIPKTLETIGRGAFAASPSLKTFTVENYSAEQDEIFFAEDGVLYRNIPDTDYYGLVAYPSAKPSEVYTVKDGTARIEGRAFEGLYAKVGKIIMPYTLKAVGERAFFGSGISVFEFKSVTAPSLESEYAPEIDDYFELNNINFRGYYYANFETYFVYYSEYAVDGVSAPALTICRPENGTGYDNHVYSAYFTTTELTETVLSAVTNSFVEIVSALPEASEVSSWKPSATLTKEYVEKISNSVKDAHMYYNAFGSDSKQVELAGQANIYKFLAVEEALRGVKPLFGINVAVSRLTYTGDFKTEYKVGEKFDMTGLQVVIVYDDYSTENVDMSKVTLVDPVGELSVLDNVVTLSVEGQSRQVSIRITVTENGPENPGDGDDNPEPSGCAGGCASTTTTGGGTTFLTLTLVGMVILLASYARRRQRGSK